MPIVLAVAVVACLLVMAALWQRYQVLRREAYIRRAVLPRGLFEKLRAKHPHLTAKDCELVAQGLRQFFLVYLKSGRKFVAMPSQVVDDLWHEFILYTKHYQVFCRRGFGQFLHHAPAAVLGSDRTRNEGLRRCWWYACREESIRPTAPTRLPLLFALDAKLNIPGGFRYLADCSGVRRDNAQAADGATYCGGDFAGYTVDGSTDGFADVSSDVSDGGGDGCGGGGCGGGD